MLVSYMAIHVQYMLGKKGAPSITASTVWASISPAMYAAPQFGDLHL